MNAALATGAMWATLLIGWPTIEKIDGSTLSGELVAMEADRLIVDPKSHRSVRLEEISQIEWTVLVKNSSGKSTGAPEKAAAPKADENKLPQAVVIDR